jgi:tetratricopeptide (TPR) repeat protein
VAAEAMRTGMEEGCPDLETIAAYLDRTLPEPERARVTEHIASCETCYFVFTESVQTHVTAAITDETAAPSAPAAVGSKQPLVFGRWSKRAVWSAAAAAMATAAAILLMVRPQLLEVQRRLRLQTLVAAVGTNRVVEPRLTGGFAYGPIRGTMRGEGAAANGYISPDVRIAAANIEKAFQTDESAAALRVLGIAHLLTGNLNRGVDSLERSNALRRDDADIDSDLSAAYLVRAQREVGPENALRALAAADRALALERLSRVNDARQAWNTYLSVDPASGWADEARLHLRMLDSAR